MSSFFQDKTIEKLNEDLPSELVKTRDGTGNQKLSYLASYTAIGQANQIFGFGKWATEIMALKQIDRTEYKKPPYNAGDPPKEMISISYLCQLKLTVTGDNESVSHEDTGFGNGVAGNSPHGIGSCIELASKEAVTDALKRCLRYYGNQFGLSLYDKENTATPLADIEAAKIVTEDQLLKLRELYEPRGISDEWVLTMLKAEYYPHDSLALMRQDWYQMAYQKTHDHKLEELERASYDEDIKKVLSMLSESATMPMLKALFTEAWTKTTKYDDKPRQIEAKKIYDEIKLKLEKAA